MTKNVLKFKKKSRWDMLGKVGVDGGIIIITDAENFPKYFDLPSSWSGPEKNQRDKYYPMMKNIDLKDMDNKVGFIDLLAHDTCMQIEGYSGYSIPWLGGDGTFPIWGRFVECDSNDSLQKSEMLSDIVVYEPSPHNIYFDYFVEFEKKKECSIDIYSGKIGIDEPELLDQRGLVIPTYSYDCPLGNGNYNIFEIKVVYDGLDPDVINQILGNTHLLGTLIELNPNDTIIKQSIKELMSSIYNSSNN